MKKVLMCRPDYFYIEYEINPWMHVENQVDHIKALSQWQNVYDAYRENGIEIELIKQIKGLPDMTFTANGGIIYGDKLVLYYPEAFDTESRKILKKIPYAIPFSKIEAENFVGNSVLVGDTLFVGYQDEKLQNKIGSLGLKLKVFKMSEFKKSGGGIKCLTLFLDH